MQLSPSSLADREPFWFGLQWMNDLGYQQTETLGILLVSSGSDTYLQAKTPKWKNELRQNQTGSNQLSLAKHLKRFHNERAAADSMTKL